MKRVAESLERLAAWVPRWWAGQGGAAGRLMSMSLWPAEYGYRAAIAARNEAYDRGFARSARGPIAVISVGNIAVGGAGKTPFAAWLAGHLQRAGRRPAIVLRGYGRDEVLVHRDLNPGVTVLAAARRADAVREAARRGCDVAVLDDAFQHRALRRDLDLVLIAAEDWHARRKLLPRGPWREPASALARAHLLVVTRKAADLRDAQRVADEIRELVPGLPMVHACIASTELRPLHGGSSQEPDVLRGARVLAVAALATPGAFLANLAAAGADVEAALFRDHHEFTAGEAEALVARAAGRPIVMTLKDAVKLRPMMRADPRLLVLHQRVEIETGAEELEALLRQVAEQAAVDAR